MQPLDPFDIEKCVGLEVGKFMDMQCHGNTMQVHFRVFRYPNCWTVLWPNPQHNFLGVDLPTEQDLRLFLVGKKPQNSRLLTSREHGYVGPLPEV